MLFNYLTEITPLLETRVKGFSKKQRQAYDNLTADVIDSFWEIYYRFQPLLHRHSQAFGLNIDDLGNILGRTILLYDKSLGFTFYAYLHKTLRTASKNLRGKQYAEELHLPLSAGRLMPQIYWLLDQETLNRGHRISPEESDQLVIHFLRQHPASFSEPTMQRIAEIARDQSRDITIELLPESPQAPSNDVNSLEQTEEYEKSLRLIHDAIERAGMDCKEQAILLQRLNLAHDESLYGQVESEINTGSMRKRKNRLLVRFYAALRAPEAKHFGRFLYADPQASRPILQRAIHEHAENLGIIDQEFIRSVLNEMSLTDSPCKVSINERGALERFLLNSDSDKLHLSGQLFAKFKAMLIDQDAKEFPCLKNADEPPT